jgi:hypothetical protein
LPKLSRWAEETSVQVLWYPHLAKKERKWVTRVVGKDRS